MTFKQLIVLFLLCSLRQVDVSAQHQPLFQLALPVVSCNEVFFTDSTVVQLDLDMADVQIFYTLDGSEPTEQSLKYQSPIVVYENTLLKAVAMHEACHKSEILSYQLFKTSAFDLLGASVVPMPDQRYAGDGVSSLIDRQKGSTDFKDGKWLGLAKADMEATFELLDTLELAGVTVSTFSDPRSWIFPPVGIEVWVAEDTGDFRKIGESTVAVLSEMEAPNLQFQTCTFESQKIKHFKVIIKNTGIIPDWHMRAGKGTWLFVDELILESNQ